MNFTIAIDGPAAAGKGTLGKRLSAEFNVPYLDTGLLYRAVAYKSLAGIDPIEAAKSLKTDDFSDANTLRTREVGERASQVAAIPELRKALLAFQRDFARLDGGAILDGRDIGTNICPEAEVKMFITANNLVRAQRRFEELSIQDQTLTLADVVEDLARRDERDQSRAATPLRQADDAILIDTSELTIDYAFDVARKLVLQKLPFLA